MQCIAENTERLDLLQKTLTVEQRQRKRLSDLSLEKQKEDEEAQRLSLYEANSSPPSVLDQEDGIRKQLVEEMVKSSTPAIAPVVKCLSNVQGTILLKK